MKRLSLVILFFLIFILYILILNVVSTIIFKSGHTITNKKVINESVVGERIVIGERVAVEVISKRWYGYVQKTITESGNLDILFFLWFLKIPLNVNRISLSPVTFSLLGFLVAMLIIMEKWKNL